MDSPTPDSAGNQPEFDLGDLEKQIQSLLGGASDDAPKPVAPPEPVAEIRDVRAESFEAEPIDPLIQEIDAALADDADALLRGANGDVGQALRSVFDERALSGQEEEINRALIEAFGTSRVERPSFGSAVVTNPVPAFDGAARELPNDIPREERDRTPSVQPTGAASAAPAAEPPPPVATPVSNPIDASAPAPTQAVPQPVAVQQHDSTPAPQPVQTMEAKPVESAPAAPRGATLAMLLEMPFRLLSAPMRAMPSTARTVLSIAAITLVLWTPVAWWLAQRATKIPAVAPIHIRPAAVVASAEPAADAGGGEKPSSGH